MRVSCWVGALLLLIIAGSAELARGQTESKLDQTARANAQKLINAHIGWRTKLSSSGATVQIKEVERRGADVKYNLHVSGLPADKLYTIVNWPVNQDKPSTVIEGASLGKGGIVICAGRTPEQCEDPARKDDPVDFAFHAASGEPYRLALIAGEYRVATVIVPIPVVGSDKGCTFSVERLLPHFELAYFSGTGFPSNADLSFDSVSYSEQHAVKTKSDNSGNLQFANHACGLRPFKRNHQSDSGWNHVLAIAPI